MLNKSFSNITKSKRELARCSLHEQRPWQAHLIETNNFEAHADMIPFSHTDLDTLLSVGCHTDKECEYTHPESIYHCIVFDKILKLPGFCSPSTKRSKRTFIFMSRHQLPPKSSSQQILPMKDKEKPQLGVSRMVSACKGNENIKKLYCFRLLFYHNRKTFYL